MVKKSVMMQGYFFSRPVAAEQIPATIRGLFK